jgi:hypothetical protein
VRFHEENLLEDDPEEQRQPQQQEQPLTWQQALANDPEYYMNTKKGQEELAQMIRKESERLLEEIGKSVKHAKDIIWLSKWCMSCKFHNEHGTKTMCNKWNARIVKPFYGRPIWEKMEVRGKEEKELVVADIDWDRKWREISDKLVEWAVEKVNGGYPYFCYTNE